MPAKGPTVIQRRSWAALEEHGTYQAAAEALNTSTGAVASGVAGYRRAMGLPVPERVARPTKQLDIVRAIPERLDEIETNLAEIIAAERERDKTLIELVALVRELNARQPIFLVSPANLPTHRRKADGGVGGRRENR